ncbi:MAG: hypothetical protein ACWA5T_12030 [Parvularcula sp.]
MGSLLSQAISVLGSPLGLAVLGLAVLAVAGILLWAFWGQNKVPTRADIDSVPAETVPPPLLAPSMFTGGAHPLIRQDATLRNALLGLIGLAAVFGAYRMMTIDGSTAGEGAHEAHTETYQGETPYLNADNGASNGFQEASFSSPGGGVSTTAVAATLTPVCKQGFTDEDGRTGYSLCTDDQLVRFDRIEFLRNGTMLLDANWNGTSGYSLSAANQPTPFAFDDHVGMRGAADIGLDQYDAFLAIGLAERSANQTIDPNTLSAERAYSLGRYALTALRGETDADCTSRARVMALSLGTSDEYAGQMGLMKPVLIGVRFDRRFAVADRDLNKAVSAFLQSRGTAITGYDLASFNARDVLFNEVACKRLN